MKAFIIDIIGIKKAYNSKKERYFEINKGIKDEIDCYKEEKTTTINIRDFKNPEKFKFKDLSHDNDCDETKNFLQLGNNNTINNDFIIDQTIGPPEYDIDIKSINEKWERDIYELMIQIKDPNLSDYEKRKIILFLEKTMTEDIRIDKKFRLEIEKIRKEYNERYFSREKKKENDDNLNTYEKKEIFFKKEKTESTVKENSDKTLVNNLSISTSNNISSLNNSNSISYINESSCDNESTRENTKLEDSLNESKENQNEKKEEKKEEKAFNKLRAEFYIKNKIFDKVYYEEKEENKIITSPKYKIDKEHYGLLYIDDLTTNYLTKSTYLSGKKIINELTEKEKEGRAFNESVGLFFCGKEIKLEKDGETVIKKCEPNNFICKECMDVNKKYYNIKNTYLINIKGRVSKINKGSFHCFGHFNFGNQIEDCITKFSCKACDILNTFGYYYK